MPDREKVIKGLMELHGSKETMDLIRDAITLLKEQEKRINTLEEKLRLLEYGDQDILQNCIMPAT